MRVYRSWDSSRSFGEAPDAVGFTSRMAVSDPGALSPRADWSEPVIWRGVNELAWIFVGLPLFGLGLWALGRARRGRTALRLWRTSPAHALTGEVAARPPVSGVLLRDAVIVLTAYVAAFTMVSWLTTETARWRLPAHPAFVLVAALGFCVTPPARRLVTIIQ